MKKFWKEFLKRGLLFAWGGPAVMCVIWSCIDKFQGVDMIETKGAVLAVVSTMLIAFVAAGITAIHQMEQLPVVIGAIIHMAVLYVAYLAMYLINGWMPTKVIGIFTIVFIITFLIIWVIVYACVRKSVKKMNEKVVE